MTNTEKQDVYTRITSKIICASSYFKTHSETRMCARDGCYRTRALRLELPLVIR